MPDNSTVFTLLLSFFFLQSRLLLPEAMRQKKIRHTLARIATPGSRQNSLLLPLDGLAYIEHDIGVLHRGDGCIECCIHERFLLLLIALVIIVGQASSSSSSSLFVVVVIIVYIAEQWTGNGKGAAVFDEYCSLTLFESEKYTWTVKRRPMPYAQETPTRTRVYGKSIDVY
jgi:hypothetical protein